MSHPLLHQNLTQQGRWLPHSYSNCTQLTQGSQLTHQWRLGGFRGPGLGWPSPASLDHRNTIWTPSCCSSSSCRSHSWWCCLLGCWPLDTTFHASLCSPLIRCVVLILLHPLGQHALKGATVGLAQGGALGGAWHWCLKHKLCWGFNEVCRPSHAWISSRVWVVWVLQTVTLCYLCDQPPKGAQAWGVRLSHVCATVPEQAGTSWHPQQDLQQ